MGFPSLNRFKEKWFPFCETHLKGGVCALNNAYVILTFFKSSSKTIKKTYIFCVFVKLRLDVQGPSRKQN